MSVCSTLLYSRLYYRHNLMYHMISPLLTTLSMTWIFFLDGTHLSLWPHLRRHHPLLHPHAQTGRFQHLVSELTTFLIRESSFSLTMSTLFDSCTMLPSQSSNGYMQSQIRHQRSKWLQASQGNTDLHNAALYSVETILLVLRPMDGVAYTTGSETAKEIHFACQHIVNCADRCADEIRGVMVHEVVHCYQYNHQGACPSGLIEGIAGTHVHLPVFVMLYF